MVLLNSISEHEGCGVYHHSKLFFDVRVYNPNSPAYRGSELATCYRRHEREKQRAYEQCVREIEYGSFTPLVFSTAGGMGNAATTTYRCLASMITAKQELPYSAVMGWLRCRITFSLIRFAIMCLRGSRSSKCNVPCGQPDSISLVFHEGRVTHGD